jgi:hypothetical protein
MGISSLRDASKKARENINTNETKYGLNSASNFLFYGSTNGKSVLSLTEISESNEPMLVVSAGGASQYLSERYPNVVFRTASTLAEAENISNELNESYKMLQIIQNAKTKEQIVAIRDKVFIPKYYTGNEQEGIQDFQYLLELATANKFIFSRVIVEECDVLSSYVQDKVEVQFNTEILGEDKSLRGKDWSALSSELLAFYSKWLRLPCMTILATGDKAPGEREGLKMYIPALCTGSGQRQLISMIGNVFRVYSNEDGYFIQVKPDKTSLIRSKIYPLNTDFEKIETNLNITNEPEKFWQMIEDLKNGLYAREKKAKS